MQIDEQMNFEMDKVRCSGLSEISHPDPSWILAACLVEDGLAFSNVCTQLKEPCIHYRIYSAVGRMYIIPAAFAIERTSTVVIPITNKLVSIKPWLYKCDHLADQDRLLPPGGARLPMEQILGFYSSLEEISERKCFHKKIEDRPGDLL